MVVDGSSFVRRAQAFFKALKDGERPNSTSLAKACRCSKNTAQRTIYRLRDEYLVPLEYDPSEKGFYLTDPNFPFPTLLPPGKDELTALLLARDIIQPLEAEDLKTCLDTLWAQYSSRSGPVQRELEPLRKVFSCDSTVIGDIADKEVIRYVASAAAGESVRLEYRSPWRHPEDRQFEGRVLRVHLSDGNLYILFGDKSGREMVLNTAFIKAFEVLDYTVPVNLAAQKRMDIIGSEHWLEGFGIWAGEEPQSIEIRIGAPASRYYAAQRWHADQEDEWDGDDLVRRFPSIISGELVKRVLSLGKFVVQVEPEALRRRVLEEAKLLAEALDVGTPCDATLGAEVRGGR